MRTTSWEPNPVLLFELRQAVRNQAVLVLLLVYVAVLSLFLAAAVIPESEILSNVSDFTNDAIGDWYGLNQTTAIAMTILVIYYAFTSLALVVFAAGKTLGDRLHENPIFYSPFPPWRIVFGKLLFGIVISLLFLSATLPFLAVTYLMRGVDIRAVLWAALLFFGLTQWHYFATVAFYAGAKNKYGAFVRSLPLFLIHLILSFSVYGVPSLAAEMTTDPDIFRLALVFIALFFILMFLAFLLAWVQYAPENSNRMMPVRISLSVIQGLVSLAFVIGMIHYTLIGKDLNDTAFEIVYLLFGIFVPCFFPIMICERETLSYRIRRTIPKNFWRRLLLFPFYTGVTGAMLWIFGVVMVEGLLLYLAYLFFPTFQTSNVEFAELAHPFSYGLICFDYCATTVILYRFLLHRWMSRQWNWLPLFIMLALSPLYLTIGILIDSFTPFSFNWLFDGPDNRGLFFMPIPWPTLYGDFIDNQLLLGGCWLLLVLPIEAVDVLRRFREFRPPEQSSDELRSTAKID